MCDCLCALGPATDTGVTLFAKNSDRPPDEAQRVEWFPPRTAAGRIRTTHVEIEGAARDTIGFVGSRPEWAWGVEHGVNEAGVAIGNETIFTRLDPRDVPPGLIGIDLVRLGLERAPCRTGRDRDDDVAARTTRPRRLGPPRRGASVLVVVPRRRRRRARSCSRRRARRGRSNGCSAPEPSRTGRRSPRSTRRTVTPGSR